MFSLDWTCHHYWQNKLKRPISRTGIRYPEFRAMSEQGQPRLLFLNS